MIVFSIPGPPVGKGRPRFARMGTFIKTYTDKDTLSYENLVKVSFRQVHCGNPKEGPIKVEVRAYFPIPKSVTKKFRTEASNENMPVTKKPDGDNIIKIILDALNQIAYKDDAQIYDVRCIKVYSENPRTVVKIEDAVTLPF